MGGQNSLLMHVPLSYGDPKVKWSKLITNVYGHMTKIAAMQGLHK